MTPVTWILILGGGLVIILLVIGIVVSATSEQRLVEERLGRFLEQEKKEKTGEPSTSALTEWVNKRVEKSSFGERIARQLARADLKFKPGEYVALIVISTISVAFLAGLIGGRHPISFALGTVVGAMLPAQYVRRQQKKRLQRFDEQLPDMLNLMVNGLRAGFSTMQAMESVAKELPPPICDEFRRVVQEMQLGIPMERALDNLLRRIPSPDLDFVVTAINVQREVGGNLSEILDTISYTIRERVRIKGEIRVLTAQMRTSGQALSVMPVALAVFLWFLNRDYMMNFFMFGTVCGLGVLGLAAALIGLGYFFMNRIANIEV